MVDQNQIEIGYKQDIFDFYIKHKFPKNNVVVVEPGGWAFVNITQLTMLKRDNFKVYMEGLNSDILFVVFDVLKDAVDFCWFLEEKKHVQYSLYSCGECLVSQKETMKDYIE